MTPFPFAAVLFDCDGVLVDSEPITNRVLAEMLGELGWHLTTEESMNTFTGKAVKDETDLIESKTGVRITEEWLMAFRARRNEALERDLAAIPHAPAAIREIHATLKGRIACASGADRHKVELQLAKVGLLDCFQGRIFSGHEMPRSKPAPDVYLAAMTPLGVSAARCAVVEDTVTGVTAGVRAGATVFGYSPPEAGHDAPAALKAAGASIIFADLADLPSLLS